MVSIAALVALIACGADHPIVDSRAFKDRTFATGVFLMTVLGFVLTYLARPIMLQTLLGYSSVEAMAPRGVGSLIMMPLVGMLTGRRASGAVDSLASWSAAAACGG